MIFLNIVTALAAVITVLEFLDPGIFSTALPLPFAWAAVLAAWALHGGADGRVARRPRLVLTALVALTTMLLVLLVARSLAAVPAALAVAAIAAAATWALTDSRYADNALQKTRPR